MTGPLVAATDLSGAAGPIGLLVIVLIGVTTVLLIRNMDKRVKNLPPEFPPADDRSDEPGDGR